MTKEQRQAVRELEDKLKETDGPAPDGMLWDTLVKFQSYPSV